MSFQQLPATTTTAASTGFSFGLTTTPAAGAAGGAKPPSFSFGSTGGGDAGATKPLTMGLGSAAAAPAAGAGLGGGFFMQPAAAATAPTQGLGATAAATPAAAATTAPPQLSFSAPTAATAAPVASSTASTATFSMPKQAGSATLGLAAAAPQASAASAAVAAAPTTSATGFTSLTTATKTTNSAAITTAAQVSYNQLEEHINKWTLELEDQEKVFTDQATQINAWDKILIGNNQKILELNDAVQKVKSDQQTLEQELEFIATQHHELEESIVPLQKEFIKIPQVDMERSQTYLMVENLDTQLKQMSEDLKEIIDNLNEANKGQDNTDPIIQIGKILNAHMSSLQWIESSSANIGNKLEDITKMHESFKRESERSFRTAYYN